MGLLSKAAGLSKFMPSGITAYACAGAALLTAGAVGGWRVESWRCAAQASAQLQAVQAALDQANADLRVVHDADVTKNIQLSKDLGALRAHAANLQEQLVNAIQDHTVYAEGSCTRSPLGLDFLRLWNDSAGGGADPAARTTGRSPAAVPVKPAQP